MKAVESLGLFVDIQESYMESNHVDILLFISLALFWQLKTFIY
ncbi:hypothetical protein ADICYQ_2750 [Cyclobacterium qasimii M12-11B]|uniref:Uncharacterized protein n=1 Tax=Cyclobacterium qasimii M12-11B TaxID=641524 RepID=S7VDH8_9BACT|nr:hypothetical protein ADICYQ_2750 [Cyclobacterium qasimii M12-11B]